MRNLEELISDLPSPETARRFFDQFSERNPTQSKKLLKNDALLSDVLALASYSPLLGTTLIQSPEYTTWLEKERIDVSVRGTEALLESLARFSLINSSMEPHVLFARFRRRELVRIFLRDIRRLGTVAEITEEISNLADAILENALRLARQEMDNRYGAPMETDENGRKRPSDLAIVALGKLGSRELNYSSDIDLLFIYSANGRTTGTGARGSVTNREYFSKLAETVNGLVGRQTGEGAAYRVDMRLRPHGRVGALALSLEETTRYYLSEARNWERQVLIRSRASAGDQRVFKRFFRAVEKVVFSAGRNPSEALAEVLRSKEKIDDVHRSGPFLDVKLGRGGIREIEFIAQALQLAFGGKDRWLHVGHSLKSISRLADRGYLTESERSLLSNAYHFLRRLEHILQMEHGLQTHALPSDRESLRAVALKMQFDDLNGFEAAIVENTNNVHEAFLRVFGKDQFPADAETPHHREQAESMKDSDQAPHSTASLLSKFEDRSFASIDKLGQLSELDSDKRAIIRQIGIVSPHFAQFIISKPWLVEHLERTRLEPELVDYDSEFENSVDPGGPVRSVLADLRAVWSRLFLRIAVADIFEDLEAAEVRSLQTRLAEASIRAALKAASSDLSRRFDLRTFNPVILALGKLGSCTLDYGSDLDLVILYSGGEDTRDVGPTAEFYSRGVESFVNFLSGVTRDGNLYRVDLRLRPYGKNGPNVSTVESFCEYLAKNASVWELLAYVQLRAIVDKVNTSDFEQTIMRSIWARATNEDPDRLRTESREMRLRLEGAHGRPRSINEVDIKFGPGGLLDVYFVVRFLQLTSNAEIGPEHRSTSSRLEEFVRLGTLSKDNFAALRNGHRFLSELDHNIRLTIGRSSRYPRTNYPVLERIAQRMRLGSVNEISEQLSVHRISIREAFEKILHP